MTTKLGPISIGVKNTSDQESKIYLLNSYSHLDPAFNVWNQNGDLIQNNYTFIKSLSKSFSYYDLLVMLCESRYKACGIDIISKSGMEKFDPSLAIVHRDEHDETIVHEDRSARGYIDNVLLSEVRIGIVKLDLIWSSRAYFSIDGYTDISLIAPPNSEFYVVINMEQGKSIVNTVSGPPFEKYDGYEHRSTPYHEPRQVKEPEISTIRFNAEKMFDYGGTGSFASRAREMNRTNSKYGTDFENIKEYEKSKEKWIRNEFGDFGEKKYPPTFPPRDENKKAKGSWVRPEMESYGKNPDVPAFQTDVKMAGTIIAKEKSKKNDDFKPEYAKVHFPTYPKKKPVAKKAVKKPVKKSIKKTVLKKTKK